MKSRLTYSIIFEYFFFCLDIGSFNVAFIIGQAVSSSSLLHTMVLHMVLHVTLLRISRNHSFFSNQIWIILKGLFEFIW